MGLRLTGGQSRTAMAKAGDPLLAAGHGPYSVVKDLCYVDATDDATARKKHHLDLYLPQQADGTAKRPLMVFLHGGGWQRGDRNFFYGLYGNIGASFAARGYPTAIVSYRLSPPLMKVMLIGYALITAILTGLVVLVGGVNEDGERTVPFLYVWPVVWAVAVALRMSRLPWGEDGVQHPGHVRDCAKAVAWLQRHAGEYGYDPERVVLSGHSAGGHLATMLVLDPSHLEAEGSDVSTIKAVCGISGVYQHAFPSALVTKGFRLLYIRPAFGDDPETWDEKFPVVHARSGVWGPKTAADDDASGADGPARQLPPFIFFNADRLDWSLESHTAELAAALREGGAAVETHMVPHSSHLGIVRAIRPSPPEGVPPGSAPHKDHVVVQRTCDFLATVAHVPPEGPKTPAAPVDAAADGGLSVGDVDVDVVDGSAAGDDTLPAAPDISVYTGADAVDPSVLFPVIEASREILARDAACEHVCSCLDADKFEARVCSCSCGRPQRFECACEWRRRLEEDEGGVLVVARSSFTEGAQVVGFAVAHRRDSRNGETEHVEHIWLCGVAGAARRRGVMSSIFAEIERCAFAQMLTVATVPARYPAMPLFLAARGFLKEDADAAGEKVLYRKTL